MEVLKKWLTYLTLVFLVNIGDAESLSITDLCEIDPLACVKSHIFDITNRDPNDSYSCLITPLQYDAESRTFVTSGMEEKVPATEVNETSVKCSLTEMQIGEVELESERDGIIGQPGLIYPKMCFMCFGEKCYLRIFFPSRHETEIGAGCYINNICYPSFIMNPANSSQICFYAGSDSWDYVGPEILATNGIAVTTTPYVVNICDISPILGTKYTRATGPAIAGREAINLMTDGANIRFPRYSFLGCSVACSIKFYVKFDPKPATKNTTFLEMPSALKVQRRPDKAFQVEYTFRDQLGNEIRKVIQEEEYASNKNDTPFGMKLRVKFQKEWNLIGLGYEMYGGSASVSFYVNGKKLNSAVGDLTGLNIIMSRELEMKNAAFSCMEISYKMNDDEYFADPNLPYCVWHYNKTDMSRFDDCEKTELEKQSATSG